MLGKSVGYSPAKVLTDQKDAPKCHIKHGIFADACSSWFQLENACAAGPAAKCRGPSEVVASRQTAE